MTAVQRNATVNCQKFLQINKVYTMTSPAESPQAATDSAFGEASIITKPTSFVVGNNNAEDERAEKRSLISITTTTANTKTNPVPGLSAVDDDSFHSAVADDSTDTDSNIDHTTMTNTEKNTAPGLAKVGEAFHSFPSKNANPPGASSLLNLTTPRGWASHWTEAEEKRLAIAVVTCGEKNWSLVAMMMPNRSKAACRRKWILSANGWTLKDDIPLCEAVEACGEGNWDEIAARMPGHTAMACRKRWSIIAESSRNRSTGKPSERLPWTDEQEKRLIEAVNTCGIGQWTVIGALVPGRSGLACREKWKRMTGKWSLEEDLELILAIKTCGVGNWKEIHAMVPKRTIRQCRFRYATIMRDESRSPTSRVFGTDETETTLTQVANKTCDAGDSDQVAGTCSRQHRTCDPVVETVPGRRQLMHAAITRDSTAEKVPGRTEVACSGQSWPWTDAETTRLVDAVKIYGEWGKWDAIAAMVPNRSEAECRLKWTSAAPGWTPQEDMLLAVSVKDCDDGAWLQVAARVPGRTRMDCFNRWTTLAEASRTFTNRLPRMSGGATNPVDLVGTGGEADGATIATEIPARSDLERRIKRQRLSLSLATAPNQPKGLPVNIAALRTPPFTSVHDGTWVSHQLALSNLPFHSNHQHMSPSAVSLPHQPNGAPMNVTAARSPLFSSVNEAAWVPYQLPPVYDFPPMLFTRHHY
jgi:hypothetical protein